MQTEQELLSAAEQLRKDMRNERRDGISGVDESSRSASPASRPTSEDARGYAGRSSGNTEINGSDDRSSEERTKRVRQNNRRSLNSSLSAPERDDTASKPIGLEPIDEGMKRPVGRPRKEEPVENVREKLFPKRATLTEKEATTYAEALPHCLMSYGEYVDQALNQWTKIEDPIDKWNNLSELEAGSIANILIRKGQKSGQAAEFVRSLINYEEYVVVGVAMVPRIIKTVEEMKRAPRRRR